MVLLALLFLTILVEHTYTLEYKVDAKIKFQNICMNLVSEPSFDDEKVLGTFWTIYYTWNLDLKSFCMDMSFQKATDSIKRRYRILMDRFMEKEPDWSKATLNQKLNWTEEASNMSTEMLLLPIPNNGKAVGLFHTVPKMKKAYRIVSPLHKMPSLVIAMKLFNNSRHLIMSDCHDGQITFSVRRDQKHTWKEIDSAIEAFDFDHAPGFPACKYSLRKHRQKMKN